MMIASFTRRAPAGVLTMLGRGKAPMVAPATAAIFQKAAPQPPAHAAVALGGVRNAGAGAIAAGASMIAIGGVAQGTGAVFAALVVGTARNPAVKDQLMTYSLIGVGMVEVMMLIVLGATGAFYSAD